jgi:hypothetical protein
MLLHNNRAAEHVGGSGRQAQKQAKNNGMHLRRMISVPIPSSHAGLGKGPTLVGPLSRQKCVSLQRLRLAFASTTTLFAASPARAATCF